MPDPAHQPAAVVQSLVAALADGRRSPLAVLDEHSQLTGWDARELDELTRAFDDAEATCRLPEPVVATVRSALQRWCREARNNATDQMPALVEAADWTDEMLPPDEAEDTSEVDLAISAIVPRCPATTTPTAAPPAFVEPGNVLVGRYEVLRRLGRGGTAFVHLARDLRRDPEDGDDAFVAIKSPRPGATDVGRAVARLKREFRQTRALSHPNIVRMHDLDRDGEQWFITMEWLDGESLVERIQRAAPLPTMEALSIARACAQALAFAHGRGIVHGDFKPSNVMIGANGEVRLLDFGAAPDSTSVEAGEDLRLFATRCYASPETLAGDPPTPRDDVFSLACVIYELLSGSHPFQRRSADTALAARAAVPPLANLSPAQNEALARGLAGRREERPFGALELLDALAAEAPIATAAPALVVASPSGMSLEAVAMSPVANDASHRSADGTADAAAPPTAAREAQHAVPVSVEPAATAIATGPAVPHPVARPVVAVSTGPGHAAAGPRFPVVAVSLATAASIAILLFLPLRESALVAPPPPPPRAVPVAPTGLPGTPRVEAKATTAAVTPPAATATVPRARTRIGFDAAAVQVDESAFAAVLTLRRSGNVASRVPVEWRIAGGSAQGGRDFAGPASGTAHFATGQTLRTLYVPLIDDQEPESAESFAISLQVRGEGVALGPISRTSVTIADDD